MKGNAYRNEAKETCCYACSLNEQCENRCDLQDKRKEERKRVPSMRILELTKKERLRFGYDILLRTYVIVGMLLLMTGLILATVFSVYYRVSYLQLIGLYWRIYQLVQTGPALLHLLFTLLPLLMILAGTIMAIYGAVRLKSLKNRL